MSGDCGGLEGMCCPWPGVTSTLAMFPLETVRTRLAVDHKTYRNVSTAFRLILGQEGIPAFYRVTVPGYILLLHIPDCRSHVLASVLQGTMTAAGTSVNCLTWLYLLTCRVLARVCWAPYLILRSGSAHMMASNGPTKRCAVSEPPALWLL